MAQGFEGRVELRVCTVPGQDSLCRSLVDDTRRLEFLIFRILAVSEDEDAGSGFPRGQCDFQMVAADGGPAMGDAAAALTLQDSSGGGGAPVGAGKSFPVGVETGQRRIH